MHGSPTRTGLVSCSIGVLLQWRDISQLKIAKVCCKFALRRDWPFFSVMPSEAHWRVHLPPFLLLLSSSERPTDSTISVAHRLPHQPCKKRGPRSANSPFVGSGALCCRTPQRAPCRSTRTSAQRARLKFHTTRYAGTGKTPARLFFIASRHFRDFASCGQDRSLADVVCRSDQPFPLHPFDQGSGSVVADLQAALDV